MEVHEVELEEGTSSSMSRTKKDKKKMTPIQKLNKDKSLMKLRFEM